MIDDLDDPTIDDDKARYLVRCEIERIEVSYLKALSEGKDWPVFWIYDLDDPQVCEHAGQVMPAEAINAGRVDAWTKGLQPILVREAFMSAPYWIGEHPWRECPDGSYPIMVMTDGRSRAYWRRVPDGTDEAKRRGLASKNARQAAEVFRAAKELGHAVAAVVLADLSDPKGRAAAVATHGADTVDRVLAKMEPGWTPLMIYAGSPSSAAYPRDWGGDIPPGRFAVQVVAMGGILNGTLPEPVPDAAAA